MLFHNKLFKHQCTMKYFFEAILFAHFVAALADSLVKPMENNNNMKKSAQSDMINNYYAGPNCKKIEQHLAEIKRDIGALKENQTSGSVGNGMFPEVKQQLDEIKQGIKELKENQTRGAIGNSMFPEVKQQLDEIKQGIKELKENQTSSGSGGNGLCYEEKQQLAELKQDIKALKTNQTGCSGPKVFKNCAEVYKSGKKISGVYKIDPDGLGEFEVFCDQKTAGGGWTVFQKRQDGSVDFYRGWNDYKRGFGNLNGEFWLGLDKIHRLTVSNISSQLRIDMEDNLGKTLFATYSSFVVADENAKYRLSFGSYLGSAGNALGYHRGMPFSTKDRDNDKWGVNCALTYKGAWWHKSCHHSNLNGLYRPGSGQSDGNVWFSKGMKRSEMKIRPKNF